MHHTGTSTIVLSILTLFLPGVVRAAPTASDRVGSSESISLSASVPEDAGLAVLHPFVSFSIEFAFFPDYAGMFFPSLWYLSLGGVVNGIHCV